MTNEPDLSGVNIGTALKKPNSCKHVIGEILSRL